MKRILALTLLLSLPATAGERYIGKIVSAAGADTSNASTATPFYIPPGARVTLWCNASAYVLTDTTVAVTDGTGANPGMPLTSSEKFPTSVGVQVRQPPIGAASDNGAIIRIMGGAAVTCFVYDRKGDE